TASADDIKNALKDLVCELKQIGEEFINELNDIEPELKQAIDDIEAEYPDLTLGEAILKHLADEFELRC
ncbi:MAG: hypothetical protein IBX55_23580, partial [Methyloprofundus sp.]|nr:hypothetical protein [Methyloprofundus sp.]